MNNRGKLDDTLAAMFSNIKYHKNYLFYAHMIAQCNIKIDETMNAPAGVMFSINRYILYINPIKFDEYPLIERLAILKHEMLHILYGHVKREESRNHLIWNYATDCALNQHIDSTHLPGNCINPVTLGEMLDIRVPNNQSSEFYYELIKDKQIFDETGLINTHDKWGESECDNDLHKDATKKMIERAQVETIKSKGTIPVECNEWLELFYRKPEVSWKKVLRGIVGNKRVSKRSTIMKSDRRFPNRDDLRGKTRDRTFNLLVIADVSSSMRDTAMLSTLGEVRHVCDVTKTSVDIIQVDTKANEPEKLSKKTKIIQRKGSGGTFLSSALEKGVDFQAIVVLTDGWLLKDDIKNFTVLKKKIIWLIEKDGQIMEEMTQGKMCAFKLNKCPI